MCTFSPRLPNLWHAVPECINEVVTRSGLVKGGMSQPDVMQKLVSDYAGPYSWVVESAGRVVRIYLLYIQRYPEMTDFVKVVESRQTSNSGVLIPESSNRDGTNRLILYTQRLI